MFSKPDIVAALLATTFTVGANERLVSTQEEFRAAVANAKPGDEIVLADGRWENFEILLVGRGTAEKPITLRAQTKGQVILSGQSNLRLAGEHLVVSGLVFRDGYSPTNTVIAFRRNKLELAHHSRVTEVVIDAFNNPERFETDFWVMMYGRQNRFDHNFLQGKKNAGVTMAVRLDTAESQNNYHRIDHNFFGPRPALGSNGGETLRIGTSRYSLSDSHTVVENNWFERCNGEVEIISSKSGHNIFRGNVFYESRGTLTLRHGNYNTVEANIFLGNGVDHTGGIRVINKHQTVRNNYLSELTGHRFGGGLVIMNGVPNSPINRYHQVEQSVIANNTLIDVHHIELAAGADTERSAPPVSTQFINNLVVNTTPRDSIAVHDDIGGITFSGNLVEGVLQHPENGFNVADIELARTGEGLLVPDGGDIEAGVSQNMDVIDRDETGPTWYPKPTASGRFEHGPQHRISPGEDALFDAIQNSSPGAVLLLEGGTYVARKTLPVRHPLTIVAQDSDDRPLLQFERTALFQVEDGGSLRLQDLIIDGSHAPDTYGNAAIRTSRYSMLGNYQVIAERIDVRNLNVNHSFHFLKIASHTFADTISIRESSFSDVTGHILNLSAETEDLGIYNAEYINVTDSKFTNIGGVIAHIYRGGTDESTFGPHLVFKNNTLDNVGLNRRNRAAASVLLHGVQIADIAGNSFANSAKPQVITTVGEPITRVSDNVFTDTPTIAISPLERP